MTLRSRLALPLAVGFLAALPAADGLAKDKPGRRAGRAAAPAAAPAATAGCKEPGPKDPDLVAGLGLYAAGDWRGAATSLAAWAAKPDAEKDPGAARGLYALAYTQRSLGDQAAAEAAMARAQPALQARTSSKPTLEAWYYLQGLHQMRGDTEAQLAAVSAALKALDEGSLCAERDGDDWFRIGRLQAFAGNAAARSEAMRAASDAYQRLPEGAPLSPYRAMLERELGEAALTSNDLEAAERHLGAAAKLDPAIPGIHRQYGIVLLKRGKLEQASEHWRTYWRQEREGGNSFMYAIPVMNRIVALRKEGAEPLPGLSQYTVPALEENARTEAGAYLQLRAQAETEGDAFPAEKLAEMKAAEHRALQYLLEMVTRGQDLQEFALQNGMLPLIHARGMPRR